MDGGHLFNVLAEEMLEQRLRILNPDGLALVIYEKSSRLLFLCQYITFNIQESKVYKVLEWVEEKIT